MRQVASAIILVTMLALGWSPVAAGAGAHIPRDIVLVLDNSGSMKQNDPQFLTKKVVADFLEGLPGDSRVGIVIFDEKANLAVPLSPLGSPATREKILQSLALVNYRGKLTDSPAGVERALYELKSRGRKDATKVIIFLTDGIVDTGDKARDRERAQWLREDLAAESKKDGIRIFGIAFTDQADFQLIQALGQKTGGGYFRALKPEEIGGVFKEIETTLNRPPVSPEVPAMQQPLPPAPLPPAKEPESRTWLIIVVGLIVLGIVALIALMRRKGTEGVQAGQTPGPAPVKPPPASLLDIRSVTGQHEYPLTKPVLSIGRAPSNDVVINHGTVSGQHATLEYRDQAFYLVDQRSANGTLLNGERITDAARLRHGDRIKFDEFEFTFILTELADEEKTQLRGAPERPAEPQGPAAGQDSAEIPTRLKDMCPNHPAWKASELCPQCSTAFCDKCMVEKDGRRLCRKCAEK